jgi:hypothetical protein
MIHSIIFEKIEGQRTIRPGEKISRLLGFQHNNRITNITLVPSIRNKDPTKALKIDFTFTTTYNPPIASIILSGHVIFSSADLSVEEVLSHWRKTNTLSKPVSKEIAGNIIARSIQKATVISDQLNIPPPIPMPAGRGQKQREQKKDSTDTSYLV